ncbi:GNAT family N-acetyltransferase [Naasia sp. SYSU D00948]|uniref:GNAT family N-acetyltransferase n=1 Tax=Naasia sp. SYSU D00948 TaxID=2817379 RepID=UPI0027DE0E0C|nr:GNAT family N-acetyltransferase [Naasia sp. SYSU D00948]
MSGGQWRGSTREQCRDALREQAREAPGPGLVAYLGNERAGWCAVEPRANYERLRSSRVPRASPDSDFEDTSIWAITCLVVRVGFRRRGIARVLVRAAIEHARANGATVVEAYPVDTDERPDASAAELYHGTVSLFRAAGLEVAATPLPGRALMRLRVG